MNHLSLQEAIDCTKYGTVFIVRMNIHTKAYVRFWVTEILRNHTVSASAMRLTNTVKPQSVNNTHDENKAPCFFAVLNE